ncbi:MAG: ABC transporter permease [Spirochaetales bacterium]|nr:ABC transporter permease [Spirochaetales bacterium]
MKNMKIAFKNLSRQKKRTIFLAGAIAFGIISVTLLDSMTGSLTTNIAQNFADIDAGHIFIQGKEKAENDKYIEVIKDDAALMDAISAANIDYRFITKRSYARATLYFEGKSVNQTIFGADWEKDAFFTERIMLKGGTFEDLKKTPKGIIISDKIAELLNADIGDKIIVKLQTAQGQMNSGDLYVVGISIDPGIMGQIATFANIENTNKLLNIAPDEYMWLGIYLWDLKDTDKYAGPLRAEVAKRVLLDDNKDKEEDQDMWDMMMQAQKDEEDWEGIKYSVITITEELTELEEIVDVLERASLIFFLVLLVIIMVGINNTFRIVMLERVREIGTMRAIGTQRTEVRSLFLMEAVFISLIGMAIGFVVAGGIMIGISQINMGVDSPIFVVLKNGHFTFSLNILKIIRNIIIVAGVTILAAMLPALKAARLEPAVALRSQK